MSHFSKIKTTLKDLSLLKKALNDLSINWTTEANEVKGYKNQSIYANIVISQNNILIKLALYVILIFNNDSIAKQ
jgi:hypothetical protein